MSVRGIKAINTDVHDILEEEYKSENPINPEEVIFALDIGTRSVVGIVGIQEQDIFKIIEVEIMKHRSRAMRDGQIHDISQVVEVVEIVKEKLESRLGFELRNVSIAAAGRSLKTCSTKVERKVDMREVIKQDIVDSLELEGIQLAHAKLQKESDEDFSTYYCIGHTVINYYLNGYVMSNLEGHKGKEIGAVVLATFLPQTVVDSLYTVMERVGLKVTSLTLEPIAAINVSIPQNVRLLNVALVDVGAGTSDIAITKDGSVNAYDMCSIAGDEITEKIAQQYLLDFNTAEKVKLQLMDKEIIEFEDIMGSTLKVKSKEIISVIEPAVDNLAQVISEKIIISNGKSPNAVFCIGGGSQTPLFTEILAKKLEIPVERVGIRGTNILKNVKFSNKKLNGPEAITPVGIALSGFKRRGNDFIQIRVNKNKVSLYNTGKVLVGDAIAASGFTPEQLIPRRGKAITFTLNGRKKTIKGGFGRPAEIFVNANLASLDTQIINGDKIRIIPSEQGLPSKAYIEDFLNNTKNKKVTFNNSQLKLTTKILLNGKPTSAKQSIKEDDDLIIEEIKTIDDLAKACEIDLDNFYIVVNSKKTNDNYLIQDGDIIKTIYKKNTENETATKTEELSENKKEYEPTNDIVKEITVKVNDDLIKLTGKSNYIFVDIFKYININREKVNARVGLKLNGNSASYTDIIRDGDNIEISWT